jgi:hypothetical protein
VFHDSFTDGERKIEAAMGGVALLKVLDNAQSVQIVVEAQAVLLEAAVEGALAGVTKGRMADVVDKGKGFGEILVEAESLGDFAGDLGDFHGVREARAEVIGGAAGEDLGLAGEAAEGTRLDDALAVPLEGGAQRVRRDGMVAQEQGIVAVSDG